MDSGQIETQAPYGDPDPAIHGRVPYTSYRPDREYVDGEVRERHAGKYKHARLQALLTNWLGNHEKEWDVIVATEQRTLIAEIGCAFRT